MEINMGLWKGNIQNLETIIFRFQRFNWGVDMVRSPGFHGAGPESQNLPSEGELENDVMNLTTPKSSSLAGGEGILNIIGVKLQVLEGCSIWQDENDSTSLCRSQLTRLFVVFSCFLLTALLLWQGNLHQNCRQSGRSLRFLVSGGDAVKLID